MTAHTLYRCGVECPGCQICLGALESCTTCNGAESSLPKDCPGHPMTPAQRDAVSAGTLNFIAGKWIGK